jgi:hypothetical protein
MNFGRGHLNILIRSRGITMQESICSKSEGFKKGANGCLGIVRTLATQRLSGASESISSYFEGRDVFIQKICASAGPAPESALGVISLLAELVADLSGDLLFDDVSTWNPETLLSEKDRDAFRSELIQDEVHVRGNAD